MVLLLGLRSRDNAPGESFSWNGWSIDRRDAPRIPCGLQQRKAGSICCRAIGRTPRSEPSRCFSATGGAGKALGFVQFYERNVQNTCHTPLWAVPPGLGRRAPSVPVLKRWARLVRPFRTSFLTPFPSRALAAVFLLLLRGATWRLSLREWFHSEARMPYLLSL